MSAAAFIIIYACMLVFDLSVLAGTVYLIADRGWSAWWMLFAVFVCEGSNPRRMIATWKGGAA